MSPSEPPADLPQVGPWARDKLDRLRKYLSAYTKVLHGKNFQGYIYVDAFSGAGRAEVRSSAAEDDPTMDLLEASTELQQDREVREVIDGSPRVALEIEPAFTHYVFLERDPARRRILEQLKLEYETHRSILIRPGDCNSYLREKLVRNPQVDWRRWRAVVFLDPFGMHVPWETLAGLAATGAIEVVLNFPLGMAIQRLLRRDARLSEPARAKLDRYFGDPSWFDTVYAETPGLFGSITVKSDRSGPQLLAWYRQRLRLAFGYVSPAYLVRNTRGGHLYYLLHAGPNETGARIARHVLGGGEKVPDSGE